MKNTFYEFKPEDALRFAREKGFEAKAVKGGTELTFKKCPYCGMTTDQKNKFSINLQTGQFNCFRASCGVKGNMLTLSKDFDFSLGTSQERYDRDMDWKKARSFGKRKLKPNQSAIDYMATRGISERIVNEYQITTTDKPNILVFPFHDTDGELRFIKYRKTDFAKGRDKGKEWCEGGERVPILFGMMQCKPEESRTLVITEGQIDSLSCAEAGIINAVSVPTGASGFTWIPHCWDWLQANFDTIVVFGDCEKGKITLIETISNRFAKKRVKHVRFEDYKDCKDANDILRKYGKEQIVKAIENAKDVEHPLIVQLSEVKPTVYDEDQGFISHLPSLDKTIKKFFPTQLCILTGERGRGKSTLASQLAIEAVSQGQRVFFYSGELTNSNFAEWTYHQVAGKDHLIPKGMDEYGLSEANRTRISKWLKNRFYLYNSDLIEEECIEPLKDTIKVVITRFGCNAIFIDNLMTAVDDDLDADIYRLQTRFIKDLKIIARTYNVFILLVAHPKKRDSKSKFVNDDILGSSNVTNLADLIIRFDVPDGSDDQTKRNLFVLKNRRNGKVNTTGFPIYYQESSRRLSESNTFDRNFCWDEFDDLPSWIHEDGGFPFESE